MSATLRDRVANGKNTRWAVIVIPGLGFEPADYLAAAPMGDLDRDRRVATHAEAIAYADKQARS